MLSIKNNNNNIGCVSGQALSPVYLIKVDFAKLLVYRVKSLAERLEHWFLYRGVLGSIPIEGKGIFQLCFTLLRLSCCKKAKKVNVSLLPDS